MVRCAPKTSRTTVRAAFTSACAASSASLPEFIASTPADTQKERAQSTVQQKLFGDVVPDAYPTDFVLYEEPHSEARGTLLGTRNYLRPPGARRDQLGATYGLRQLALRVAFIRDNHHMKWVFDGSHRKFMGEIA